MTDWQTGVLIVLGLAAFITFAACVDLVRRVIVLEREAGGRRLLPPANSLDPRVRPPEILLRRLRPSPRPAGPMPSTASGPRPGWRLVSTELLAELDPGRVQVTGEDRERLRPGDHVELIFLAENEPAAPYGEKLWGTVSRSAADGTYVGELNERPSRVPLAIGAEVHFGPEHVNNLQWREDDDEDADDDDGVSDAPPGGRA